MVIPAGRVVLLDENPPALAGLTIDGELRIRGDADVELQADWVLVNATGTLRAGAEGAPVTGRVTITLRGSDTSRSVAGMGTRGILVAGGRLDLHGRAPARPWTRLAAHAEAGATRLTLQDAPGWRPGDRVVVAPTGWYPDPWAPQAQQDANRATELHTLAGIDGTTATLGAGLGRFRWGLMQHVTDAGLSLTPGTFTRPHPDAVDRLDERAEVASLSRPVVIQSVDDALWQGSGFGAHVMVMGTTSSVRLDGVEMRRMGQAGRVGRYPLHWHNLSYAADGRELGDAAGHFIRNSAIWNSRQRCIVVHGTNGVTIRDNVCHDIRGHGIFLEDAVERRNVIEGNLVLQVRAPVDALALTPHERRHFCGSAAAFWLTNPDNTVRGNVAVDAQGNGFWLSYPDRPVKDNRAVPIRPRNLPHAPFDFNTARSNGHVGVMLDCAMTGDAGDLALTTYAPTRTGAPFDTTNGVPFTMRGVATLRNWAGGYVNRAETPQYVQWVAAGNAGRGFSGAVSVGSSLRHSLIAGRTLNEREAVPPRSDPRLGVASYHSTLDIAQNTFVHLDNRGYLLTAAGNDLSSGAFGTDDYYMRPVEKGMARNPGNRLIDADPGYRALPPHLQPGFTPASRHFWTLAGAIWDPQGHWGPARQWWVFDHPFLSSPGCTPVVTRVPAGRTNGLSCPGPYHGVMDFQLDRGLPGATPEWNFREAIEVRRLDAAGATAGTWRVEAGHQSSMLGQMRHFAALRGQAYVLRFPEFPAASPTKQAPRRVSLRVENLIEAGDHLLLGVHYDGGTLPSQVYVSTNPDFPNWGVDSRRLAAAASLEAVRAGDGGNYWRDAANDLVWVKLVPLGLPGPWARVVPGSDADLYRRYALRIEP